MATILGHRELVGLGGRLRLKYTPSVLHCGSPRKCLLTRAALPPQKQVDTDTNGDCEAPGRPSRGAWRRVMQGVTAGCCSWVAVAGSAFAGIDGADAPAVAGPTTDILLGGGNEFSFTSLLLFTLLGYWLLKGIQYLKQNTPNGPDQNGAQGQGGDKQKQDSGVNDMGHAHIRSYVDSSQPGRGSEADARELRNTSLARSAAFRVTATVRESQPRIHSLVEELAGPQGQWPLQPPRNADVDFVATMVYNRVIQEREAKGPENILCPRERAALETLLLEEVAEKCAAEQVTQFIAMAAQGKLHPNLPGGGGAGPQPQSQAH